MNKPKAFGGSFDKKEIQAKIEKYEKEINQKNFWNDPKRAQEVIKAQSILKNKIDPWEELINKIKDLSDLCEIVENEKDINSLEIEFNVLEKQYKDLLTISYFKEELDINNAFLTIHSGAGGTEACDWVTMLYRMYSRYAERKKYKTELIDLLEAEGGIKSVTIEIKGEYAYGLLKSEVGIHRLIRISPFDAAKKRHTSFASVFVDPVIDEKIEIIIKPEDIRIDTYRASGAGGATRQQNILCCKNNSHWNRNSNSISKRPKSTQKQRYGNESFKIKTLRIL